MENNKVMLINAVPAAAHLREVVNFNPKKFLQRGADPETGEVRDADAASLQETLVPPGIPQREHELPSIRVTDRTATYEAAAT